MGSLTAAADDSHLSGAMIALMPTREDAERLAVEGGEDAEQLHLTLYFLGDDGEAWTGDQRNELIGNVRAVAASQFPGPITARTFGANHWNANTDSPSWVWAVGDDRDADGPGLKDVHRKVTYALEDTHNHPDLPVQHSPWVPHICAAYSDELDLVSALEERLGPVTFDRIRLAFAGDHTDIPLGGGVTAAADGSRHGRYQLGDRVRVLEAHDEDHSMGSIVELNAGPAYGFLPDGEDEVHHWYVGEELAPADDDGMTAASGPLRRKPTELELASRADFAQMDRAWHEAVDGIVEQWAAIQAAQREQITAAVQAAVDAEDIDRLTTTTVSTTDAANLLFGRMQAFALQAGMAQQREAEAQGVTVPEWSLDDEALTAAAIRDRLRQVATTTARLLGLGLVQSAVRRAVQLFGSGTGAEVAAQVDEHLSSLSGAQVEEQVGAAMTAAQNEGRFAVLSVAPPATYTATEILDRSTCSNCREIDGTEYGSLTAARAAYPSGGYVNCLGGPRCRGTLVTVWPQDGEQAAAGMILDASGDTMPPTSFEQEGTMPYRVEQDHPDCGADTPWAVVKEDGAELMGCHATEDDAHKQMAALYAEEGGDREKQPKDIYGAEIGVPSEDGLTAPIRGPLVVEAIETGDGREFASGVLTWDEPPLPLRWNKEDSHGGEPHTVAVNVGRMDRIWREDNTIMFEGVLNLAEEDGRRIRDMIKGKFIRGISIDADSIADADVEFVWPEDVNAGTGEDEGDLAELLFAQPEKVIYHGGRIRAATIVDIPAFAEAYVELLDEEGAVVAGGTRVTAEEVQQKYARQEFGAVGSHDTGTSDGDWDGPANEARLSSPMSVATARNAYAWIDNDRIEDGEIVKDAGRFIHHEVSADGRPGAANLTACSTGIGILNGGRGGTTIPASDRQGVWEHLAAHLRDADREPPPLQAAEQDTVTAAAVWQPPAEWFADPKLSLPTPITIADDGRIYGHAAQWGSCHIGQEGACIKPPREDAHPYYRTGEVVCADGSRVAVGQITVGTGHAPLHYGAAPAAEHYDNTGAAVADVAVGNDQHGIWVAGAVRPGADPLKVYELQAAGQVSGDWRRIGGQLRLVGLLAVNVPGFPVPKMRARVASGQPQALVAAGRPTVGGGMSQQELEQWATRVVMRMLSRQVHPGGGDR